jgi:hypothetical protein
MTLHIAQVNIARMKAPLEDPLMAGFVARLEDINALADKSPGFVWRLQTEAGYSTYLRPYEDDRILCQRQSWFEKFDGMHMALWWVPAGHIPCVDEAKKRLAHLDEHGPSPFAFTFKKPFPADAEFMKTIDWGSFKPCPAM